MPRETKPFNRYSIIKGKGPLDTKGLKTEALDQNPSRCRAYYSSGESQLRGGIGYYQSNPYSK